MRRRSVFRRSCSRRTSLVSPCQSGLASKNGREATLTRTGLVILVACLSSAAVMAQPSPSSWSGVPEQIIPSSAEVGAPTFTTPSGSGSFGGLQGNPAGGGGTGSGATEALALMTSTSWGSQAAANAQALGVNPAAIAAMCAAESQCQNLQGSGSASGPFQMIDSTYNAMIAAAAKDDPSLAASFAGKGDPATEAAASAELMKTLAVQLQSAGVQNPTVMDVRAGYAFGGSYMAAADKAPDSTPLSQIVTGWTSTTYQQNGLTPDTTIGQWRQTQITTFGASSASQTVLGG